jgi:hypothetical protein
MVRRRRTDRLMVWRGRLSVEADGEVDDEVDDEATAYTDERQERTADYMADSDDSIHSIHSIHSDISMDEAFSNSHRIDSDPPDSNISDFDLHDQVIILLLYYYS